MKSLLWTSKSIMSLKPSDPTGLIGPEARDLPTFRMGSGWREPSYLLKTKGRRISDELKFLVLWSLIKALVATLPSSFPNTFELKY